MSKYLLGMVLIRILSGTLEITAALIMYRLNSLEKALLVNSTLALVGPFVLITTTALGLVGVADKLSYSKLLWIIAGLTCLFIGIFKR
ncbi:hypothetical protein PRECH8_00670 [Insulibacter thermoxylanivorax]|uniref:DUF2619 domain-containing protein n=1 Tax=Insulibacter thermoxylanivorax TaxID=2749268 RepID=A0A916VEX7_9BACL|nr:YqhV family protein [Insulibacter thermoxylanivorax]GFR36771.1 hypothetical protein PRECH8_00670 [Insulibacter thermoxylanivorax]